jgi:hypothetical protein
MRLKQFALAGIAALLIALGWYLVSPNPSALSPESPALPPPTTLNTEPAEPSSLPASPQPAPTPKPANADPAPSPAATGLAAWELKIDEALRTQADHSTIAKVLLQQIPYMPPEGQQAAAQHITNLISDKDYLDVIPYVQNSKIGDGFQEIIVSESLNRPNSVKLPVLLASARMPKHPMKETAISILSVLLDQNHGNDWAKWEAAVNEALKQQP